MAPSLSPPASTAPPPAALLLPPPAPAALFSWPGVSTDTVITEQPQKQMRETCVQLREQAV